MTSEDALVIGGAAAAAAGLYLVNPWLALVWVGLLAMGIGLRRG